LSDTAFEWTLNRTFVIGASHVEALRRSLSMTTVDAKADTEPFFHLTTLLEFRMTGQPRKVQKGLLTEIDLRGEILLVKFASNAKERITLALEDDLKTSLTIWRVNDVFDALQLSVSSKTGRLYLQTGGAGLSLLSSAELPEEPLKELFEIFSESPSVVNSLS
jgi:hypothetical protein